MGTQQHHATIALQELRNALKNGLEDRELFTRLVSQSMEILNMDDSDVADKLPVSRSAVSRWRRGQNVPLPMMRKPVYKLFIRKMRKHLQSEEAARPSTGSFRTLPAEESGALVAG